MEGLDAHLLPDASRLSLESARKLVHDTMSITCGLGELEDWVEDCMVAVARVAFERGRDYENDRLGWGDTWH